MRRTLRAWRRKTGNGRRATKDGQWERAAPRTSRGFRPLAARLGEAAGAPEAGDGHATRMCRAALAFVKGGGPSRGFRPRGRDPWLRPPLGNGFREAGDRCRPRTLSKATHETDHRCLPRKWEACAWDGRRIPSKEMGKPARQGLVMDAARHHGRPRAIPSPTPRSPAEGQALRSHEPRARGRGRACTPGDTWRATNETGSMLHLEKVMSCWNLSRK